MLARQGSCFKVLNCNMCVCVCKEDKQSRPQFTPAEPPVHIPAEKTSYLVPTLHFSVCCQCGENVT